MFSVVDQLYQTPSFRAKILSIGDDTFSSLAQEDCPLYQLKKVFESKTSEQAPNLTAFAHSIKNFDGNPMKPTDQIDSNEFLSILLDQLERDLKLIKHDDLVTDTFGGLLCNELISQSCSHLLERSEAFFSLGCDVLNMKDLNESLQKFVEGERLDGVSCLTCEQKGVSEKRTSIKKAPQNLIIHCKRITLDFETFTNKVIPNSFDLPFSFNILPFTTEAMRKKEGLPKNISESEESKQDLKESPPSEFEYRLTGFIAFRGSLTSGGVYYSFYLDRKENCWYKFDGKERKKVDLADLPQEIFKENNSTWGKSVDQFAANAFYERINQDSVKDE